MECNVELETERRLEFCWTDLDPFCVKWKRILNKINVIKYKYYIA